MNKKKVFFDNARQWQVEETGSFKFVGHETMVNLQVIGADFKYRVTESVFESDRFEEVAGCTE